MIDNKGHLAESLFSALAKGKTGKKTGKKISLKGGHGMPNPFHTESEKGAQSRPKFGGIANPKARKKTYGA